MFQQTQQERCALLCLTGIPLGGDAGGFALELLLGDYRIPE
jgi:hypothetical protein